jgi:CRP/FNR family transcriptional regulator, cyclic AMP receptor protein
MHHRALVQAVSSKPGTFLGQLPDNARSRLIAEGALIEVPRGASIFSAVEALDRTGVVLRGLARTQLIAADGRRLGVRFAKPGTVIGSLTDARSALGVYAVTPCTVLELSVAALRELMTEDSRVGLALVSELSRRLRDTHATLAGVGFGTMRERVAWHLLDLAAHARSEGSFAAPVTQQDLAEGVGTVREVVARVLRDLRREGFVATREGSIEILDADALEAIVQASSARSWMREAAG